MCFLSNLEIFQVLSELVKDLRTKLHKSERYGNELQEKLVSDQVKTNSAEAIEKVSICSHCMQLNFYSVY